MAQHESESLWGRLGTGLSVATGVGGLAGLAAGVDCLFKNPAIRSSGDVLPTLACFTLLVAALCLPAGVLAGLGCQIAARLRPRAAAGARPACLGVLVAALTFVELWDRSYTAQQLIRSGHESLVSPAQSWLCLAVLAAAALAAGLVSACAARRLIEGGGGRRWLLSGAAIAAVLVAALALRPRPRFQPPLYTPALATGPAIDVRLVVVDGADWRVAGPLVQAGRMPNLAGLMERGAWGELGVSYPSESPHMWTALSTGVEDDVNGLCEFYAYRPPGSSALITRYPGLGDSRRLLFRQGILLLDRIGFGSVHLASSAQKRVPELWDYLGDAGKTVGVVGWRFTAPAEPVRGFLLTDRFGEEPEGAAALFPPELARLVVADNATLVEAQLVAFGDFAPQSPQQALRIQRHLGGLRENLERDLLYFQTARRVLAELEPDFLAVAHRAVDGLEHMSMLWHALARRSPDEPLPAHLGNALARQRIEFASDVVTEAYAVFDQELGLLLEGLGDDVVIVVSDHGHDLDGSGHQFGPPGIIVIAGGPIAPGAALASATVFDVLPTVLHLMGLPVPQGLDGRVLEETFDPAWSRANTVVLITPGAGSRAEERRLPAAGIGREDLEELRELGYVE